MGKDSIYYVQRTLRDVPLAADIPKDDRPIAEREGFVFMAVEYTPEDWRELTEIAGNLDADGSVVYSRDISEKLELVLQYVMARRLTTNVSWREGILVARSKAENWQAEWRQDMKSSAAAGRIFLNRWWALWRERTKEITARAGTSTAQHDKNLARSMVQFWNTSTVRTKAAAEQASFSSHHQIEKIMLQAMQRRADVIKSAHQIAVTRDEVCIENIIINFWRSENANITDETAHARAMCERTTLPIVIRSWQAAHDSESRLRETSERASISLIERAVLKAMVGSMRMEADLANASTERAEALSAVILESWRYMNACRLGERFVRTSTMKLLEIIIEQWRSTAISLARDFYNAQVFNDDVDAANAWRIMSLAFKGTQTQASTADSHGHDLIVRSLLSSWRTGAMRAELQAAWAWAKEQDLIDMYAHLYFRMYMDRFSRIESAHSVTSYQSHKLQDRELTSVLQFWRQAAAVTTIAGSKPNNYDTPILPPSFQAI